MMGNVQRNKPKSAKFSRGFRIPDNKFPPDIEQLRIYYAHALMKGATDSDSWPEVLDSAGKPSTAGTSDLFFASVLDYPITDSRWSKDATGTAYTGPHGAAYIYEKDTGKFEQE